MATVQLSGFAETVKVLQGLGAVVTVKVIAKAMRQSPKPLLQAARQLASKLNASKMTPERKQNKRLYQSLNANTKVSIKKGVVTVRAGVVDYKKGGYHAHLVELGHRMVVGGTVSRLNANGTPKAKNPNRTGKGKAISQVPPYPFLKPAWDSTKSRVLYKIEETVKQTLVDQCVELARKEGAIK